MMFAIKRVDEGIAFVFGAEYEDMALELYPAFVQKMVSGNLIKPAVLSTGLKEINRRVRTAFDGDAEIQLTLNNAPQRSPAAKKIERLSCEKKANEISAILFDKIKQRYGRSNPVYFRPFYTDLEEDSGILLSAIHAERTEGKDRREYPYRKIDTILSVLGDDYVYKFA